MLQKITGQLKSLQFKNSYGVKLTKPFRQFTDYEFEKFAYKRLCTEYRKKHSKEHLDRQTLIENDFIEKYNQQQIKKQKNQEIKFRTSICKISNATQNRINEIKLKQKKKNEQLKKYLLEQDVNKMNRRRIVQMLNEESKNWYNENNLDKLKDESLIPNYIYDETDYYLKLHEEALLYSIGDFDGLEELQSENKYIKYKNKLLMPIYQEIVSLVKHMKNTNLQKLEKEFEVARAIINQKFADFTQFNEKQQQLELLDKSYSVLKQRAREGIQKNQVEFLQEHLLALYNLLDLWNQYTTIVKMNNSVAEQLLAQENSKYEVFQAEAKGKANTFEESLKSASEQETSEGEEEIDLTSYTKEKEAAQQTMSDIKDTLKQQDLSKVGGQQVDEFDSILSSLESEEKTEEFEQEFEQQYASQQELQKSDFSLGQEPNKVQNAQELYQGIDLENIFSRSLINSVNEYKPHLKHESVEDIKKYEQGEEILLKDLRGNQKKLETSVICQVFAQRIEQLKAQTENKKELHQIKEIEELLTLISEQNIVEPKFLLQVWNTY